MRHSLAGQCLTCQIQAAPGSVNVVSCGPLLTPGGGIVAFVDGQPHVAKVEERLEWHEFIAGRPGADAIPVLAEYWADGHRSILEIIDLIDLEIDVRDAELIVRHFELLQKLGLVTYVAEPKETIK